MTAYAEARTAQAVWSSWPLKRRVEVMKRFHELLLQRNLVVDDLMQAETGKARRMSFEETCDVVMTTSHYIKAAPSGSSRRRSTAASCRSSRPPPRCMSPRASSG